MWLPDATELAFDIRNQFLRDGVAVGTVVGGVDLIGVAIRAGAVEAAVASGASAAEAAASAADGLEPPSDLNAGVDYRCHLARVLTRRGLEESGC